MYIFSNAMFASNNDAISLFLRLKRLCSPIVVPNVFLVYLLSVSSAGNHQGLDAALDDLSTDAANQKGKADFDKVFAQFLVKYNISVAAGTDFLHALHRKQCTINYATLPRDARTLTNVIITAHYHP